LESNSYDVLSRNIPEKKYFLQPNNQKFFRNHAVLCSVAFDSVRAMPERHVAVCG
jgi:hypothetical protein